MSNKVLVVFGTRPEAIKLAPVIRKLPECVVLNTGQHQDILDLLDIPVHYNLNCMDKYSSLSDKTGYLLLKIMEEAPKSIEMVIVQGDTVSALSGALFAFYNNHKLVHVEAGLRTYDKNEPWPEETNRFMIDHMSDVLFAPTQHDVDDLLDEDINPSTIHLVGNTIVDSLLDIMEKYKISTSRKQHAIITLHRRENATVGRIGSIFRGLRHIIACYPDIEFIYPVHPSYTHAYNELAGYSNVKLINSLPYYEFIKLLASCKFIITDSGGIQEEAAVLHKPVIVLRERTERFSLIENGGGILAGTSYNEIVNAEKYMYDNYEKMCLAKNPFGEGDTSDKIVDVLKGLLY